MTSTRWPRRACRSTARPPGRDWTCWTCGPAQTVLVTGASGGVGGFAVQLAAAAGAQVVAVASTGDEEYVAGLGAKLVLPRAESAAALAATVRAHFPDGVDAVFDAAPIGAGTIGAVRDGGAFVGTIPPTVPEAERGIGVLPVQVRPDAAQLSELVAALASGRLTTRVAGTLPFGEAAEAHRRSVSGLRGKLVLVPESPVPTSGAEAGSMG